MDATKTLEIISRSDDLDQYVITTPDGDDTIVNSYEIQVDGDATILHEGGITTIDISPDRWFDVSSSHGHAVIDTVDENPNPVEVEVPYICSYTTSELCSEEGLPNTKAAQTTYRYMPSVRLVTQYHDYEMEITGVRVNGDLFVRNS